MVGGSANQTLIQYSYFLLQGLQFKYPSMKGERMKKLEPGESLSEEWLKLSQIGRV